MRKGVPGYSGMQRSSVADDNFSVKNLPAMLALRSSPRPAAKSEKPNASEPCMALDERSCGAIELSSLPRRRALVRLSYFA